MVCCIQRHGLGADLSVHMACCVVYRALVLGLTCLYIWRSLGLQEAARIHSQMVNSRPVFSNFPTPSATTPSSSPFLSVSSHSYDSHYDTPLSPFLSVVTAMTATMTRPLSSFLSVVIAMTATMTRPLSSFLSVSSHSYDGHHDTPSLVFPVCSHSYDSHYDTPLSPFLSVVTAMTATMTRPSRLSCL